MEWRTIRDPELLERYELSEDGRIRNRKGRELSTYVTNSGYRMVQLGVNGKLVRRYLHRLVATEFLEAVEGKNTVNHKNGEKLSNHYTNLEWCTQGENNAHAARTLGHRRHNQRLTIVQAQEIRRLKEDKLYTQKELARRFGVSEMLVSRLIHNVQFAYDYRKAA